MSNPFRFRLAERADGFQVVRFTGRERINETYRFRIDVLVEGGLQAEHVLGQRASLEIGTSSEPRFVHGVITACELGTPHQDGRTRASLRLEPRLATLRHASGFRIFHDQMVIEIVARVLLEHLVPFVPKPTRPYERRAHRIQRGERDLSFLQRILADDGLFYVFEQAGDSIGGELLVFGDHASGYTPLHGTPTLRHVAASAEVAVSDDRTLMGLSYRASLRTDKHVARRFEHERPTLELGDTTFAPLAVREVQRFFPRPGVAYEHDHAVEDLGRKLQPPGEIAGAILDALLPPSGGSADRLDAARRRAKIARATSLYPHLMPGATFVLQDHAESALNTGYVVAAVRHEGRAPEVEGQGDRAYVATVELAPCEAVMRPKRVKRALAPGLETATVSGPPGETVFTDDQGRIQVRFHWDLETGSLASIPLLGSIPLPGTHPPVTAWLRVAQPWAGPGLGANFTPRIGSEVLVGYIDADADKPIVIGSVHNAANPTPWSFPHDRTKSGVVTRSTPESGGGNELVFQDRGGEEMVSMHSAKTLSITAVADGRLQTGGSFQVNVGGDASHNVVGSSTERVEADQHESVGGARTLRIAGEESVDIGGNQTLSISGHHYVQIDGEVRVTVAQGRHTVIGKDPHVQADESLAVNGNYDVGCSMGLSLTSPKGISLRCGESRIHMFPDRIVIASPEIELQSSKALAILHEANGKKSGLRMNGATVLSGPTVGVESAQGGKLILNSEARLNGAKVKLNCGEGDSPPTKVSPDDPDGDATFEVLRDGLPPDVKEVTLVVSTPSGEIVERVCPVGSTTTFQGRPGQKFTLREVRIGDKIIGTQKANAANAEEKNGG